MTNGLKKFIYCLFISIIACISWAKSLDRIVAVVNDTAITQTQLDNQMSLLKKTQQTVSRQQLLERLIDIELQMQVAYQSGIAVDESGLNRALAEIAQRNHMTPEQLRVHIEQEGIDFKQYREQIRQQIILQQIQQREVSPLVDVSAQEINTKLRQLNTAKPQRFSYHVMDLLIPVSRDATESQVQQAKMQALIMVKQIKLGAKIQSLAQASQASGNAMSSLDLGWRTLDELPDIFQITVRALKPNSISAPIRAANGWHVLHLTGRRDQSTLQNLINSTHVRHILIRTTPILNDAQARVRLFWIRKQILEGADFGEMAKQYSNDPTSASKGGDLGWTLPGVFESEFEEQMNRLSINQISPVFRTQFGWHIVQVLGRKKLASDSQILLRKQASELVYREKFEDALKHWIQTLRKQAHIKIFNED
jgi:peptidyl-prolyl cis-trans isomerase SurA